MIDDNIVHKLLKNGYKYKLTFFLKGEMNALLRIIRKLMRTNQIMYIKKNFNAAFGWEETNKKKKKTHCWGESTEEKESEVLRFCFASDSRERNAKEKCNNHEIFMFPLNKTQKDVKTLLFCIGIMFL